MLVNGKTAHLIQTKEEDSMDFNIFRKKADGQNEAIDPLIPAPLPLAKRCSGVKSTVTLRTHFPMIFR